MDTKKKEDNNYIKQLSEFSRAFKDAFSKSKNDKEDKKGLDLEIRTTKEDINGTSLEIFTFDKTKYFEYFDNRAEYFNDSLHCLCLSLNFDIKKEDGLTILEEKKEKVIELLSHLILFILGVPINRAYFRNKGKKFSIDFLFDMKSLLLETLLNLNIDISEYHNFNLALKFGIILADLLEPKEDINIIFQKIYQYFFP